MLLLGNRVLGRDATGPLVRRDRVRQHGRSRIGASCLFRKPNTMSFSPAGPRLTRRALSGSSSLLLRSNGVLTSSYHCRKWMSSKTSTPAYPGHIPLNWFENTFLAAGSAVMALVDPRRGGTSEILFFGSPIFVLSSFRLLSLSSHAFNI
jgi:hypothetical protein